MHETQGRSLRLLLPRIQTDTGEGPSSGLLVTNRLAACYKHRAERGCPLSRCYTLLHTTLQDDATYRLKRSGVFPKSTEGGGALWVPFKHGRYSSTGREQREMNKHGSKKKKSERSADVQLQILHVPTYNATMRWWVAGVERDFAIFNHLSAVCQHPALSL